MGGDKNYHLVIFISIFNREKNLLCIFYQLFEHVEILYSKNFSGYFTQPTAFTINTHLYFDKINVLQVCILTVESYSMGYLEMIVRRSGIIVVIICAYLFFDAFRHFALSGKSAVKFMQRAGHRLSVSGPPKKLL